MKAELDIERLDDTRDDEPQRLVFELCDMRDSNYSKDEDADEGRGRSPINYCTRRLMNNSSIEVWEEGQWKRKKTRYIKGCDEYLVEKQAQMGVIANPREDNIWLVNGRLAITAEGIELGMFRYLTEGYNGNRNMKQDEQKRRPRAAEDVIYQIDTVGEAIDVEANVDAKFSVQLYLQSLKSRKGNKYVYNEDAIEFLCSVFKIPRPESGYKSEAWVVLWDKSEEEPERFLRTIQSKRALIESDVVLALSKGVISVDSQKAAFTEPYKVFREFAGSTTEAERLEMVIDFFSNPENAQQYDMLRSQLKANKAGSVAVID
jgi:hypothetical protein